MSWASETSLPARQRNPVDRGCDRAHVEDPSSGLQLVAGEGEHVGVGAVPEHDGVAFGRASQGP